jgi:ketosteroid isomerase-like protein
MDAKKWMESYAQAWEKRDPELAAELFTEEATYQEDPFDEPLQGRAAIREYWQAATRYHRDVHMSWGEPVVVGELLIAEWRTKYSRLDTHKQHELRGIMLIEFEGELAKSLREYWLRRP